MPLVEITQDKFDVELEIAYATPHNFTGQIIYAKSLCFLHKETVAPLSKAIALAKALGYRIKIFDAFRPTEAQWKLWEHVPDPNYVADPNRGSPHGRGVAIDLTLLDADGSELDMGTPFDDFAEESHHGLQDISAEALKNRSILLGIMAAAGWDHYMNEWWHYQLFNSKQYPLLSDKELGLGMMEEEKVAV